MPLQFSIEFRRLDCQISPRIALATLEVDPDPVCLVDRVDLAARPDVRLLAALDRIDQRLRLPNVVLHGGDVVVHRLGGGGNALAGLARSGSGHAHHTA